jgi:hypothetical protein
MKLRNFNLSFLVLVGLMFLSFAFFVVAQEQNSTTNNVFLDSDQDGLTDAEEKTYGTDPRKADTDGDGYSDGAEVRSGYDPLKPAPGDKIATPSSSDQKPTGTVAGKSDAKKATSAGNENLTEIMSQKISDLANSTNPDDQDITMEKLQSLIDDALNSSQTDENLPTIDQSSLKIKKQNYKGTADEIKAKKKEDFLNYSTAVLYIFSSNSPKPITSASDITSLSDQITQQVMDAVSSHSPNSLSDLSKSGEKIMEQLKEVEVPEDLLNMHIKALNYANYAKSMQDYVGSDPNDPIKNIANLSKIKAFIGSLSSFDTEIISKFSEYGVTYDQDFQNRLKKLGITPPNIDQTAIDQLNTTLLNTAATTDLTSQTSQ